MRRALALPLLAAAALLAGCAWSVPADPGQNARLRGRSFAEEPLPPVGPGEALPARVVGPSSDDGARALYASRCGSCHAPFSPRFATADEWPAHVRKYGPRAGLFGADRERVLRWLVANAR